MEITNLARLIGWPVSSRAPPVSISPVLGLQVAPHLAFILQLRIWTQVLMLMGQALDRLSHLLSPYLFIYSSIHPFIYFIANIVSKIISVWKIEQWLFTPPAPFYCYQSLATVAAIIWLLPRSHKKASEPKQLLKRKQNLPPKALVLIKPHWISFRWQPILNLGLKVLENGKE